MTITLTEFLLARIAEDGEVARAGWVLETGAGYEPVAGSGGPLSPWQRRLLAECEAKRRIVEATRFNDDPRSIVDEWLEHPDLTPPRESRVMINTLRALAAVYADHQDFRAEWLA